MKHNEWDDDFDDEDYDSEDDSEEPTMACPHCGDEIHEESQRCPRCGSYISEEDSPPARKPWWIIVGVLLMICVLYLWTFW